MRSIEKIILAFICLEILLTLTILISNFNSIDLCIGGTDCNTVQNSEYGKIAGVRLSLWGFTAFISLLLIYLSVIYYERGYILYKKATLLGACISIYLIYLQLFIIKKICSSCLAIDVLMIIICAYSYYAFQSK